jgi:hypothetical protein
MNDASTIIITVLSSVLASSGLWGVILYAMKRKDEAKSKDTAERKMLVALAHDRIYYLCEEILTEQVSSKRQGVDIDEYENLRILYEGYHNLGGNGTCERLFNEVSKLPIVKNGRKENKDE